MQLNEANVIGSAIRLDELPPEYRKLKFLGRGATTLAFERDPHTVVIFTRDQIKLEWLRDGLRLVHDYRVINPVRANHIPGMSNLPIYMVIMPRLYPLNAHNRALVRTEMQQFTEITRAVGLGSNHDWSTKINQVIERYEQQHPHSVVLPLLEWLINYDPEQFYMDMGARQFKQTLDGDIVLLDPVVSSELLDLFRD